MLQRFDIQYLRDFRGPITAPPTEDAVEESPPPPAPPPSFDQAQLDKATQDAHKLGYIEGVDAGLKQSVTEQQTRERNAAEAATKIAEAVARLVKDYNTMIARQSVELPDLILLIARKVAGDALNDRAPNVVRELVLQRLPVFYERPRVVIELHPQILEPCRTLLTPLLEQKGFMGDVVYRANETIGTHDARVDWGVGESTRSGERLWRDIEALIHATPVTLNPT